jgi:hypothetical protein
MPFVNPGPHEIHRYHTLALATPDRPVRPPTSTYDGHCRIGVKPGISLRWCQRHPCDARGTQKRIRFNKRFIATVFEMIRAGTLRVGVASLCLLGFLAACSGTDDVEYNYPRSEAGRPNPNPQGERETVFGPGGLDFLNGGDQSSSGGGGGAGIGVNSFLWRASLDTFSFMPLSSADPFGGVIITDWYSPPETPDERFKMNIYILDRRLRADGIRVAVFRQTRQSERGWIDAKVNSETAIQLENAILTRARQLRLDTIEQ